jgi:hypothetical protein
MEDCSRKEGRKHDNSTKDISLTKSTVCYLILGMAHSAAAVAIVHVANEIDWFLEIPPMQDDPL